MKKQMLIFAVLFVPFANVCLAQSAKPAEKPQNTKHIKQLIEQRCQLESILADHKRFLSLPDANEKLAEYKGKLKQIKNPETKNIPADESKRNDEQWEKFKQMNGDEWKKVYMWVRSDVSQLIELDDLDTEIEPFYRFYHTGTMEARQHLLCFLDIDKNADQDEFWREWKKSTALRKNDIQKHFDRLKEKYKVPDAVIQHAHKDSMKELHEYAYGYLIELLSEEKKREREKELERIEAELAKYPDWKKIEQELMKPVKN